MASRMEGAGLHALRSARSVRRFLIRHRVLWLGVASVMLLSGCALMPIAENIGGIFVTIATVLGLAACGGGGGGNPPGSNTIPWPSVVNVKDLTSDTGFILEGVNSSDQVGLSVAAGGDVNGDGKDDLIVGSPYENSQNGAAYVVFGATDVGTTFFGTGTASPITAVKSPHGFALRGVNNSEAGFAVGIAPNANGDSLADILIGEPNYSSSNGQRGRGWVVFGDANFGIDRTLALGSGSDIASGGSQGFSVVNTATYLGCTFFANHLGTTAVGLDINGDGLTDAAFGGPGQYSFNTGTKTYVNPRVATVFGKSGGLGTDTVNADATLAGTGGGFLFPKPYSTSFYSKDYGWSSQVGETEAAGDVNGDGIADLIVSARTNLGGEATAPAAVVVFGQSHDKPPAWPANFSSSDAFIFTNTFDYAYSHATVAYLGDVNGDGIGDFAVAWPSYNDVFVVFGSNSLPGSLVYAGYALPGASVLDGTNGFRIDLPSSGSNYQFPVAVTGADVNNDGVNDIIIEVAAGDLGNDGTVGQVIFGKSGLGSANGGVMDLSTPLAASDGFSVQMQGTSVYGYCGSLAIGDVNGDGYKDLVIGVPHDPYTSQYSAGRVYVIFSPKPQ